MPSPPNSTCSLTTSRRSHAHSVAPRESTIRARNPPNPAQSQPIRPIAHANLTPARSYRGHALVEHFRTHCGSHRRPPPTSQNRLKRRFHWHRPLISSPKYDLLGSKPYAVRPFSQLPGRRTTALRIDTTTRGRAGHDSLIWASAGQKCQSRIRCECPPLETVYVRRSRRRAATITSSRLAARGDAHAIGVARPKDGPFCAYLAHAWCDAAHIAR